MANVLAHLSSILIPAVIFFIIGYGWIHKCNLYDDFINGAADGLKTVVGIVPTLIGLMMGSRDSAGLRAAGSSGKAAAKIRR